MDDYILTSSALNVTELKLNANSVGQQNAGNGFIGGLLGNVAGLITGKL